MKILKLVVCLSLIFFNGCMVKKEKEPEGQPIKIKFEKITSKYFGIYDPETFNIIEKDSTQYSALDISKMKMSIIDFEKVQNNILNDGWLKVDENEGLYRYYFGEYQSLTILYPTKSKHFDSNGNIYKYDDLDNWAGEMYFNKFRVDNCMLSRK